MERPLALGHRPVFAAHATWLALVVVLTFGAYLNAFAMIRPVYALQDGLARLLRTPVAHARARCCIFAIGLVVLPAVLLGAASAR